jgi:hypothetical protein
VGGDALFEAEAKPPSRTRRQSTKPHPGPAFERWYSVYPVHKARGEAEKAWGQVTAEGAEPEVLTAAAERYRLDPLVIRGYGKHPATWLRAKCWLDEPSVPKSDEPINGTKQTNFTDEEYARGWK